MYQSKYFNVNTDPYLKCPCCGLYLIKDELLRMLDVARGKAGIPFYITSGTRCWRHNESVGGKRGSSHTHGTAVDIGATTSRARFLILSSVLSAGFKRVGVARTFIHVDVDKEKPQAVVWLYS